ncbi:Organic cation transporter protein [Eumeta japonica]|uniref:Organic cation transporter protein n=1 Tax=Eumeta variegata TaxID=151549 RepID=A0A4C1Z1Q5_EUMVA|nr:Organic cation transporter protein [Eumeta japonica]
MEVDPIEKAIGRFGPYQAWILLLLSLGRYPTEFQLTNVVFILPDVDYVCADNPQMNVTHQCPCENPVYDQSIFESTVTSTWNLICDRTWLASLAQSILQVGILAGSIVYGYISDRFGRKPAVLLALSVEVAAVALSAVVPELWMFIICRFLIGVAIGGTMLCCYVYLIELCGKSFRPYIVAMIEMIYVTGYMMLPGVAYLVKDWRQLQLVVSLPWVFVIAYYWLIPESPRWLVTVGKKKEAIALLTKIAKKNKKPVDNMEDIVNEIETEALNEREQRGSYIDLFKTPKLRIYTLVMAWKRLDNNIPRQVKDINKDINVRK